MGTDGTSAYGEHGVMSIESLCWTNITFCVNYTSVKKTKRKWKGGHLHTEAGTEGGPGKTQKPGTAEVTEARRETRRWFSSTALRRNQSSHPLDHRLTATKVGRLLLFKLEENKVAGKWVRFDLDYCCVTGSVLRKMRYSCNLYWHTSANMDTYVYKKEQ